MRFGFEDYLLFRVTSMNQQDLSHCKHISKLEEFVFPTSYFSTGVTVSIRSEFV